MSAGTSIEWTENTWNPIRGTKGRHICQRISDGCKNCYAARMNIRFGGPDYVAGADTPRLDLAALALPLHWRKPRRIFVCSMTDLFWEAVPDVDIAEVFRAMSRCQQHTFQVLTKRASRMAALMPRIRATFPALDHVWLGVSVEDQEQLRRIDALKDTPSAVRWVSFEPLLEDLGALLLDGIHWAVWGGESGPGARPCQTSWIRSGVRECRRQGVAPFVKQLGSRVHVSYYSNFYRSHYERGGYEWEDPIGWNIDREGQPPADTLVRVHLKDRKGGDPAEWPEDLRDCRAFPKVAA